MVFIEFLPRILCMNRPDRKIETDAVFKVEKLSDISSRKYHINPDTDLGKIYTELKFISDRMREQDFDTECQDNWKFVSSVFDR